MLANNFSTSTCSAIFDLIKFMGFGSTLSYPHEEFLISRPPRTRSKFKPLPPRSKFNPRPPRTRTLSSAGSRTRPANADTRNPRRLTGPAQDSITYYTDRNKSVSCFFTMLVQVSFNIVNVFFLVCNVSRTTVTLFSSVLHIHAS